MSAACLPCCHAYLCDCIWSDGPRRQAESGRTQVQESDVDGPWARIIAKVGLPYFNPSNVPSHREMNMREIRNHSKETSPESRIVSFGEVFRISSSTAVLKARERGLAPTSP
ncbi:hypothetical protein BJX62DRAFT_203391 [Aspergillus germanicus]